MSEIKGPKRFICESCNHKFSRPKIQRAVFSDFTQVKYNGCPKCSGIKLKDNPEWVTWMDKQRQRQIERAKEHNNGYILGVKVSDE